MATPIIASINPFPNDVRIAFQAYIQDPKYINRERIPYEKWHRIHRHLDNPTLKPENAAYTAIEMTTIAGTCQVWLYALK
jgi:hypothetical protein